MNKAHAMYLIYLADIILNGQNYEKWIYANYAKWSHIMSFCFTVGLITQDIDCDGYYLTGNRVLQ